MTILVTGATGTIGSHLVPELLKRKVDVRALVRDPAKADFPKGVELAVGGMLDVDAMRKALDSVRTLFLLTASTPDELTQAMFALNLAGEAGIRRIVYFSVLHSDRYENVPHFASKHAVERMIEAMGLNATILRPAYFMENDRNLKDMILNRAVYPMPIGDKGLVMVDVRDIAETAAIELVRRDQAEEPLPRERINVIGPEILTGPKVAQIWTEVLGRRIVYGGDDAAGLEQSLKRFRPAWQAYDMRVMVERFQSDGLLPEAGDVERLTRLLGRPLRTYRAFAEEVASAAAAA